MRNTFEQTNIPIQTSDEHFIRQIGEGTSMFFPYHLTPRELDVLNLLAHGLSNKEIAQQLSMTHNTANQHLKNIYRKLAVSNRVEAVTLYLQLKDAIKNTQI